ncbi:MAG: SDR family NAD(P)-dependent oxidoreductase [Saprospiraceae bacterium]|nr:SDR family NAD(P)-dependent oxidoreductase [Saprospiraceae bacterium]MCB9323890.1 SDR family NAD(P)-dependent oxidoreductase [Lewinellaceae bacterium]
MTKWNANNIPDQSGRVVVITGATSGLGKEAARVFAQKNATVVLAVRDLQKAEDVAKEIRHQYPQAIVESRKLDLNSLQSVHDFADDFQKSFNRLDILINNAGVMLCPFSQTEDGFEIQMGVNHLGHFALSGLLMPLLKRTEGSRIVVTSSIAHRQGNIDFDDINWEKRPYKTGKAYGDSKMANLYFAYELARKSKNDATLPLVTAAHPGYTSTDLQRHSLFWRVMNPIMGQNVEHGVLPTLRAAIDPEAKAGDFYGPSGFLEMNGSPVLVKSVPLSHDENKAKKLWKLSEELTKIKY